MRTFFTRIWLCCTSPSFYKQLKGKSFWSGFWYLYWLLVVTTFISAVIFAALATAYMPKVHGWISEAKQTVPNLYPAELVLTLSGGELSTNVEEPYVFPLPPEWDSMIMANAQRKETYDVEDEEDEEEGAQIKHLLVIDTHATVEQYPEYETAVLFTKTAVVARDNNSLKVMLYSQFQNDGVGPIIINRELYDTAMEKMLPLIDVIPAAIVGVVIFALVLMPWVGAAFGVLGYLFYLLMTTLLVWCIAAIMSRKFTYGELYKLGLYGLTPPIIIAWIVYWIAHGHSALFTPVFLVMMGMVMKEFPKRGKQAGVVVTSKKSSPKKRGSKKPKTI